MRYFIMNMITLTLVACNLANPVEPTPAPPPAISPAPTTITMPVDQVAYWQMRPIDEDNPQERSYVFFEQVILSRVETATSQSEDIESNLSFAIGAVLIADNIWQANGTVLEGVTVESDLATVRLNGEIRAVGGAILSLVPTQFLLTIFEDDRINRAIITLNGESLGNIGASHDSQLRPADFTYTRDSLAETLANAR